MSFEDVFVLQVAPVLGAVVTELLYLGPIMSILQARKNRTLDALNPILFAVTAPQALQWTVYGAMKDNVYLVLGSLFGIVLGLFYFGTCLRYAKTDVEVMRMELIFLGQFTVTAIICVVRLFAPAVGLQIAGLYSMIASLVLYISPLINIRRIILTRDASTINRGFLIMQIANGFLWTLYSFFAFDVFVLIPSAMSFLTGAIQGLLVLIFRNSKPIAPPDIEIAQPESATPEKPQGTFFGSCYRPPSACQRLSRAESAPFQPSPDTDATNSDTMAMQLCGTYADVAGPTVNASVDVNAMDAVQHAPVAMQMSGLTSGVPETVPETTIATMGSPSAGPMNMVSPRMAPVSLNMASPHMAPVNTSARSSPAITPMSALGLNAPALSLNGPAPAQETVFNRLARYSSSSNNYEAVPTIQQQQEQHQQQLEETTAYVPPPVAPEALAVDHSNIIMDNIPLGTATEPHYVNAAETYHPLSPVTDTNQYIETAQTYTVPEATHAPAEFLSASTETYPMSTETTFVGAAETPFVGAAESMAEPLIHQVEEHQVQGEDNSEAVDAKTVDAKSYTSSSGF